MKLVLLLLLIAFFPVSPLYSQTPATTGSRVERGTLTGVVKNETGTVLPGASIYLHDIRAGAISNNAGVYTTAAVIAGNYLVEVSHAGYSTVIETLKIQPGTNTRDFVLNATIVEQEAVTVTGVSSATRVRQSPQPVTVVSRTELMRNSSTNLMDALAREPGITTISTGPAISKPVIRGLGYNRVLVINDGMRQEGQQWGDEHGVEIDEYSVQRAEILKGPASLIYGSDAIAGVVNIITNQPVEPGAFKGNVLSTYNTNNGLVGLHTNIGAHSLNGFNWRAFTSLKSAADYQNKYDGRVLNSRYNERNFGGYIGVNKSWGFSHLVLSTVDQRLGLVEGARDQATGMFLAFPGSPLEAIATPEQLKSRKLFVPYQRINHSKIIWDNSLAVGRGRLAATVGLQVNNRKEFGDAEAPEEPEINMLLRTINYNFAYHLPDMNGWRTSFGINGMQQSNKNKAEETIIPAYDLLDAGGFVISKKSFGKLHLSGGIRADTRQINSKQLFENNSLKFAAFKKNFTNISGSIGISYEASGNVLLKANVARGYRAPSIAELASNGAHEGTNRYEYGDNNLKNETSLQFDAGFELNTPHVTFGLTAFANQINNYIYYRKLSAVGGGDSIINLNGEDLGAFRFDQAKATLVGLEANFDVHPHPLDWLHFENTFSFVHARFDQAIEGTRQLPFIPAPRLLSELRADFAKAGSSFGNLFFKVEMDYTAPRNKVFTAYNTETPTAGYALVNLGAGADIMMGSTKLLSIYLLLNNVTDKAYQNHLSRLKYTDVNSTTGRQGVFNMGRNFNIKINIPIDFAGYR